MKKKIVIVFTLILTISTLLTGLLSLSLITNSHTNEIEKRLISNAYLVEGIIQENLETINNDRLQNIAKDLGEKIQARITIINDKGYVLADTLNSEGTIENHIDRPEVERALENKIGKSIRYSNTAGKDMLYIALATELTEQDIAIIRVSIDLLERDKINKTLFLYTVGSMIFGLIAALFLGYRFIGKLMEPVNEIIEASKKIADGKFNRRVKIQSNDEIGELASNFNDMADHLEKTIIKLSNSNINFKALLTSMINPIIAVDKKQNIILFNQASEELFNIKSTEVIGKNILDIIDNNLLDKELNEIFNNNEKNYSDITIKHPENKILKVFTNPILLEKDPSRSIGLVALIEDVTEIRRLEEMRSDFVANVSHELKTPLTSISGFIETLKLGSIDDEKTIMRFLDIIDIEAERLKRLINDILTLSEIENMQTKIAEQEICPGNSIREVTEILRPIANMKEIELIIEIDPKLPSLYGNRDWFKQLIINLIDNAIKYTSVGGKVQIIAYEKYNNVVITIKDTGIGIPKKDLSRLFERFYRVDKARSRKVGGTGLGLAIVKHIVLSLNGRIRVNSEEGRGTEFTVIIPID